MGCNLLQSLLNILKYHAIFFCKKVRSLYIWGQSHLKHDIHTYDLSTKSFFKYFYRLRYLKNDTEYFSIYFAQCSYFDGWDALTIAQLQFEFYKRIKKNGILQISALKGQKFPDSSP